MRIWAKALGCGGSATTTRCSTWSPAPTCRAAAERGVRIGAQVSYRDLAGFGRRFIDTTAEDLTADVIYQIGALQALAHAAGSTVTFDSPI